MRQPQISTSDAFRSLRFGRRGRKQCREAGRRISRARSCLAVVTRGALGLARSDRHQYRICGIRPVEVVGHDRRGDSFIAASSPPAWKGAPLRMPRSGRTGREYLHACRRLPAGTAIDLTSRAVAVASRKADQWGRIVALAASDGRPIGAMDAFIAAIAAHRLTLVTRNTKDFETTGCVCSTPWSEGPIHDPVSPSVPSPTTGTASGDGSAQSCDMHQAGAGLRNRLARSVFRMREEFVRFASSTDAGPDP